MNSDRLTFPESVSVPLNMVKNDCYEMYNDMLY